MALESLRLQEFGAFEDVTFDFCRGLNVIIGENATGKSHAMKAAYSVLRSLQKAGPKDDPAMISLRLKDKLSAVFRPQDGEIGRCSDFLFDDRDWTVRYVVADTRMWLPGRKVLISPISIGNADASSRTLSVGLTRTQIKDAPPLDEDAPVSRRYEIAFNQYYNWAGYWGGPSVWGPVSTRVC